MWAACEKLRQGGIPGEVAAVLDCETGERGQDGRRWRFFVASNGKAVKIEALLVGSEGGEPNAALEPALLEAAVERRIVRTAYRSDRLLAELANPSPIQIYREDLRLHPPRDGSVFF